MPNPNVPSFPVCKRLAKVWQPAEVDYAYNADGELRHQSQSVIRFISPVGTGYYVPAPTCAEMLAEIQRRSWGISLHRTCGNGYWTCYVNYRVGQKAVAQNGQSPTEALALALAEALENEGART